MGEPVEQRPAEAVTMDDLWDAMWEDLRHNATGRTSGAQIITRWRVVIEAAVREEAQQGIWDRLGDALGDPQP